MDILNKKILIGLSGGINSMAVLCWLADQAEKPKELHLFYAHFSEHSPDTRLFVEAGFAFAKKHFETVFCTVTENSVIEFFADKKFIPHPTISPCSADLKIIPMLKYAYKHNIEIDLIGFIADEQKRMNRLNKSAKQDLFFTKKFPISDKNSDWCFEIVKNKIGWYPAIYDKKDENGKRIFTHNNCLPCKNMTAKQLENVKKYYPAFYENAHNLEKELGQYFGRKEGEIKFCRSCKFD